MQLYEEGKIDLDRNINDYISPYKVINKYHKEVTCRNLLTNSSSIDETKYIDIIEFKDITIYKKNHKVSQLRKI